MIPGFHIKHSFFALPFKLVPLNSIHSNNITLIMADNATMSWGLSHLFVTVFLFNFSHFMVVPAMTDVSMAALCPGQDECSFAIYLNGVHQAVRT